MESRAALCLIGVLAILSSAECLSSKGTDFVMTFLDNVVEYYQDIPVEIWVTNDGDTPAVVTISAPRDNNLIRPECTGEKTVTIPAGEQHKFGACWWARLMTTDSDVNDKVIRIQSDVDVSVIAVNKEAFSADAYQILPVSSLGTSYYSIVSGPGEYQPNTFAVVSTRDDTTITITLPENGNADGPPPSFNYRCLVHESGSTFTIKLFAHQVFYVMTFADITGTKIIASDPVAVFNGNTRANEPAGRKTRDHICEQAISSGNWDSEYLYTPEFQSQSPGDNVRVLSDSPNNVITWVDAAGVSNSITLGRGEWKELSLSSNTLLTSSEKFMAVVCGQSQLGIGDNLMRDPTLRNLQGLNQFTNSYTFPAIHSAASLVKNNGVSQPYTLNYFGVTVATADKSGLTLNGTAFSFDVCSSIPNKPGMESCSLKVDGGSPYILKHDTAKFGAHIFASDDRESVSTTLGMSAVAQCEKVVMRRGDGADNDCDGLIDEEVCDSIDNDNDGETDEDCEQSSGQARGRTYVIVFPDNSKADGSTGDLNTLELYISPQNTESNTTVTVTTPIAASNSFTEVRQAQALMTTKIVIPKELRLPQGSGKYDRTLLIEASHDIVVYGLNKIKFSSDGYLAIPVDATGYDYYAACFDVSDSGDVAEFAVTASDVGTTNLEITLASNTGVSVNFEGTTYAAGETITTSLAQYQSLQIQSNTDLTGTRIFSTNSKRIGVFSGNRRPIIGGGSARDHIVEQLNPVPTWGREFFTSPIKRDGTQGNTRGDYFRVIVSEDNTDVTVTSSISANNVAFTIPSKGGFRQLEVGSEEYIMISTSKPALVVQYSKTQLNSDQTRDKGDPSMALVIPKESWTNDYRFVTPRSGKADPSDPSKYLPYTSRMSITIETANIPKLRYGTAVDLFSVAFPSISWTVSPGSNPEVSVATVDIAFGQNYVTAVDDVVFGAMMYGAADREFYSNPISLKLIAGTCEPTETQAMGDGLDNDCDDLIDEELCNDFDDDNDGLVDEDCSMPPSGDNGRYIFNFMDNVVEYPLVQSLTFLASSTCDQAASVRLRTPGAPSSVACDINVMIPSGGMTRFAVPNWFRQYGSRRYNRTLLVESSCPIDLAAYNMDRFSNDAFNVRRTTKLGTEYRAMCYWPATLGTVVSVIAAEATTVTVQLPAHPGKVDAAADVLHPALDNVTVNGGSSLTVPLAQYESFQLTSTGDLSGAIITAPGNLAVFSGNIRVGIGSKSRDHIVEQLSPWNRASNEWIVATNGMTSQEQVKFTCSAGTTITFPADGDFGEQVFTFSSGGWVRWGRDRYLPYYYYSAEDTQTVWLPKLYQAKVQATGGNCQLMIITRSQATKNDPFLGDPTLAAIVPVSQYITKTSYAIPVKPWRKLASGELDDYQSKLVIVALTAETSAIKLDGQEIIGWQTVTGDNSYSVTRVDVNRKPNQAAAVLASTNGETFSARLWGVADRESFAYTLGIEYN